MFCEHTICRACGHAELKEVFSLGVMPLANDFVKPGEPRQGFAPLRVMFCRQCSLAQLGETVDPEILYKNYLYTTSNSQTMLRHFDRLVKDIASEATGQRLVEIGSNCGRLLRFAKEKGYAVMGIEPASNLWKISSKENQVPTCQEFFNEHSAKWVLGFGDAPHIILARHCFCHQEWRPFMNSVGVLANDKTLVCIEVPYVKDLLARAEFDSIYHEHTSYLSLRAMSALLQTTPFHIHAVIKYGIHGGALLVLLRHNNSGIEPHLSADEYLAEETVTENDWLCFAGAASVKIKRIKDAVREAHEKGQIVSAFGASAKCSVLINACGFTKDDIAFVTDNSPLKPGRLIPGTQIPIIHQDEFLSEHPDVALLAAWNYRAEVLASQAKWRSRGGKFLIPTPDGVEIV